MKGGRTNDVDSRSFSGDGCHSHSRHSRHRPRSARRSVRKFAESPRRCLKGVRVPFRDHLDEHPADRCGNSVDNDPNHPSPDHVNHVAPPPTTTTTRPIAPASQPTTTTTLPVPTTTSTTIPSCRGEPTTTATVDNEPSPGNTFYTSDNFGGCYERKVRRSWRSRGVVRLHGDARRRWGKWNRPCSGRTDPAGSTGQLDVHPQPGQCGSQRQRLSDYVRRRD